MQCSTYAHARTASLDVAYLEWNPSGRQTAVLLHGWPDSPSTWREVAELLSSRGYRVLCPALRGFGPTRFLSSDTCRSAEPAALGRDLLDFLNVMRISNPLLVGHDWGARAVASACALQPGVAAQLALLSIGYGGANDPRQMLPMSQAHNYWYQWFMALPQGVIVVQEARHVFCRYLWDTWSQPGWYDQSAFEEAALAFDNPDWAAVTLHYYRHRWGLAEGDPVYAADTARMEEAPILNVPTLVLHGAIDSCTLPGASEGKDRYFGARYERHLLDDVGHFPQREAPQAVANALLEFCGRTI